MTPVGGVVGAVGVVGGGGQVVVAVAILYRGKSLNKNLTHCVQFK